MSFINKIKSLFKNQEQSRTKSREEVIREKNKQETKRNFEPPTYNYKTAKEKATEPIPPDERNWVLRFQNQECPYCHHIFEQIKGNRKCPECKNKVIVRSHFQTKEKCILTEEELPLFEKKKTYYYDVRWCIRETSMYDVSEKEFYKQWDKMGKAYSPFDVMWDYINKYRIKYAQEGNWGLYRNTFVDQAQNLNRRGKHQESYRTYLYLAFIDANGPTNSGGIGGKPFDMSFAFQAPHTLSMIQFYTEKFNKTLENIKNDFYEETEKEKNNALYPLKSDGAWKSVLKEYKKHLKDMEALKAEEKNNS